MRRRSTFTALAAGLLMAGVSVPAAGAAPAAPAATGELTSYLVVFDTGVTGTVARQLVTAAGGTVASDLTDQIGVVVATSAVPGFDATLRASGLVEDAGERPPVPGSACHAEPGRAPAFPAAARSRPPTRWRRRSGTCSRSAPRRPTRSRPARGRSMSGSWTAGSTATTSTSWTRTA